MPLEWALTTTNLASAYTDRIRGDRDANLERAIDLYERVLEVRSRAATPREWATTVDNLASAYADRAPGDRAANLDRAIALYRSALSVRRRRHAPFEWAKTTANLASAHADHPGADRAGHLERAIASYRRSLTVFTRESLPLEWAATIGNLAGVYAARPSGDSARNRARALELYEQALAVRTRDLLPAEHRRTQRELGDLHFAERRWAEAFAAYAAALAAGDLLYLSGATPEARASELREARGLSAHAAYCLARLGRFGEAAEVVERGKARALSEALNRGEAAVGLATQGDRGAFVAARTRVAALESEARADERPASRDFAAISADLRDARAELARVVERVRSYVPDFLPEGLDLGGIAATATAIARPLVYPLTTTQGSLALIVPPGAGTDAAQALWLDRLATADLDAILFDRGDERGYLAGIAGGERAAGDTLSTALDTLWPPVSRNLAGPIADWLAGGGFRQAALIPSGDLALLPLHASADTPIAFFVAPSARSLATAHRSLSGRRSPTSRFLGVGAPLAGSSPLAFARREVAGAAARFPPGRRRTLSGRRATRAAVLAALPGTTHLHLACHGVYDPREPLDSTLRLAGGGQLALREILAGGLPLDDALLLVLSACQSGLTDFQTAPTEALGFPAAFQQAGVPGVIGTLWPVDDCAAALLLAEFYRRHLGDGLAAPEALLAAQGWLREATAADLGLAKRWEDLTRAATGRAASDAFRRARYYRTNPGERPYRHALYWAAFVFYGVAG